MKSKLLTEQKEKTYAIIFETGNEVKKGLEDFAKSYNLTASSFKAIGAFERATLGYFEIETKEYEKIPIDGNAVESQENLSQGVRNRVD